MQSTTSPSSTRMLSPSSLLKTWTRSPISSRCAKTIFPNGSFADAGQGESDAYLSATLCFFAGCVLMMILDKVVHALDASGIDAHELDFEAISAARELELAAKPAAELAPKRPIDVVIEDEDAFLIEMIGARLI